MRATHPGTSLFPTEKRQQECHSSRYSRRCRCNTANIRSSSRCRERLYAESGGQRQTVEWLPAELLAE
ncbi:hypothetical protein GBAR_LOCUS25136 [Geodia barretti]|uniref:Uncharacterized protein n=1 Tax=Geodia barretti TaxID=519541 RepID=A0AA35TE08_GEOBA|nr:hypothetical protein GBAR_LOCUS25136 [Geodia barretti]